MEDGVGGDEAHRRLRGLLVEQRGGEGGGRVERLARQEVHYEKPECHDQPRQNPTHRALDDDTLKRSLHDRYPPFVLGALLPPISCGAPPAQPPVRYSIFAGRFPILVRMTGHATPPELPPGLLEEYLAGMRPGLAPLPRPPAPPPPPPTDLAPPAPPRPATDPATAAEPPAPGATS